MSSTLTFFDQITVIPQVLYFQLVHNYGAAFGIFQHQRFFLLVVGVLIVCLGYFFRSYFIKSIWSRYAMVFLFAGAFGNIIDRFRLGYVVDFIDIRILPVFNFADIFINIAVICFIVELVFYERYCNSK